MPTCQLPSTVLGAVLAMASLCSAQLPREFALVLTDSVLPPETAFFLVDTLPGGIVTPLQNQSVFTPMRGIAIQPDDPAVHWYTADASSLPGVWRREMRYGTSTRNVWGLWERNAVDRLAIAGDRFVLIDAAGGLAVAPLAGGAATLLQPGTFVDIAARDTDIAALQIRNNLPVLSTVDLQTATVTDLGTFLGATCVALRSDGQAILGTDGGELLLVDRLGSGAILNRSSTGSGPIRHVAVNSFDQAVFATDTRLFNEIDPLTPRFSAPNGTRIVDIDVNRVPRATTLQVGNGCGAAGRVPQHDVPTPPVVGDAAFQLIAQNGPRSAPAALNLGGSATFSQLFQRPLPFDLTNFGAPGCELAVDVISSVPASFDALGTASLSLPLPSDPTLVGQRLFLQWFTIDGGRLSTSNALGLFCESR